MTKHRQQFGFSLLELTVAMAVFLVVGAAAVSLFRMHMPLFTEQQSQTAVNIALRNAAAQMQIDLVNAGTGYYQGANIPTWPLGVTVAAGNGPCYTPGVQTYGPGCFDTLNVITIDPNTPPAHPTQNDPQCANSQGMASSSILFATPIGATTVAQLAADYSVGDEVLVVKSDGSQMSTAVLTKAGAVTGNKVQLQHNPIGIDGSDPSDYYNIANPANNNKLGTTFCSTDWVLKINAVTYKVDATNPADSVLVRVPNNNVAQQSILADQVIGFRVGAYAMNPTNAACPLGWWYDTSCFDFNTVQAVRISLIGRTNPFTGASAGFRNTFDGGPYKVEGVSVVVDPRNLSMNN